MTDEVPIAQAAAAVAISASLIEVLVKRGMIERADVDAIIRDAASYLAALDCSPDVEREALRVLTLIGKTGRDVAAAQAPIPVVDPA